MMDNDEKWVCCVCGVWKPPREFYNEEECLDCYFIRDRKGVKA